MAVTARDTSDEPRQPHQPWRSPNYYPDGKARVCRYFPELKVRENTTQECNTPLYCPPIQVMIDLLHTSLYKNCLHNCQQSMVSGKKWSSLVPSSADYTISLQVLPINVVISSARQCPGSWNLLITSFSHCAIFLCAWLLCKQTWSDQSALPIQSCLDNIEVHSSLFSLLGGSLATSTIFTKEKK